MPLVDETCAAWSAKVTLSSNNPGFSQCGGLSPEPPPTPLSVPAQHTSLGPAPEPLRDETCTMVRAPPFAVTNCNVRPKSSPHIGRVRHDTDLDALSDLDVIDPELLHDDSVALSPTPCLCCSMPLGSCPNHIAATVELVFQLSQSGLPNRDGLKIPLTSSGLNLEAWQKVTAGYFDREDILESIAYGWDLSLVGTPTPTDAKRNHASALNNREDTQSYINKELEFGCLVGPIPNPPFSIICSPLGSVPKPGSSTRRTITDCSYNGKGVNSWIPRQWYRGQECKIRLPGMDDIVDSIRRVREKFPGEQILGFKLDLSRYYRNLRVDPGQSRLLGVRWEGKVYMDMSFSFGNRAAMVGAQRSSDAIAWVYRTKVSPDGHSVNPGWQCKCSKKCQCGSNELVAYVDDFIGIAPASLATHLWNELLSLVQYLGLAPSSTPGHLSPPASTFVGLGVEFDLVANTAAIPADKLKATIALVDLWLKRSSACKKELQQLLGKLLHCSRVVRSGRLHVSRMLDTLRRSYLIEVVPLDSCFKADLEWWRDALVNWNGVSTLQFSSFQNEIALDASTNGWYNNTPGLGGFNFRSGEFFKCGVPEVFQSIHICDLELLAHIICVRLWGKSFSGCEVWGKTDNKACEYFLQNGRSRQDIRLRMGRTITHLEHRWGFIWVADGIRTHLNVLPDCLSRWACPDARALFASHLVHLGVANPTELPVLPHMFDIDFRCCETISR